MVISMDIPKVFGKIIHKSGNILDICAIHNMISNSIDGYAHILMSMVQNDKLDYYFVKKGPIDITLTYAYRYYLKYALCNI